MGRNRPVEHDEQPPRDIVTFDTALDRAVRRGGFLTTDVTQSDLTKMNDANLAGRLAYYERSYTFERNGRIQAEYRNEVERTRIEINRRKMYATAEADRVFEL